MSTIDIRHAHPLSADQARSAIDRVAQKLQDKFDVATRWEGQTLRFARAGVDGAIELLDNEVRVTAELGFLLSAMKGMVESEIVRVLGEQLR